MSFQTDKNRILKMIKNKLIVSCQAEKGEPLYGADIIAGMAVSAFKPESIVLGGQISKAYRFFDVSISKLASENDVEIIVDTDSAKNALAGAFEHFKIQGKGM